MAKRQVRTPVERTQVVYSAATSLDGFIADEQGGVDWLNAAMVPGEGYGLSEFMASVDAVLMGSRTYEKALELGDPGAGSRTAARSPSRHRPRSPAPIRATWWPGFRLWASAARG
jgi:dihydrofolate reductase